MNANAGSRIGSSLLLLAALFSSACDDDDVIIDDWGTAGYAVVEGSIPDRLGQPARSDVFVTCGLEQPGEFGRLVEHDEYGNYHIDIEWPFADQQEALAANDWKGVCRISAPGYAPPFAEATDTVLFAPTRAEAVVTTMDLLPVQ